MKKLFRKRKGSLLINSVILMFVLVLTGAAFLKWTADEAYQARFDLARTQAYYVAQKAAIETGLAHLRKQTSINLPRVQVNFPPTQLPPIVNSYDNSMIEVGYTDVSLIPEFTLFDSSVPADQQGEPDSYVISSTGIVHARMPGGGTQTVERSFHMKVEKPSLSKYFYFTDSERTEYNEIIWFYERDVVYGPVRSNDQISIKNRPVFHSEVIQVPSDFNQGPGFNPDFQGPEPQFDADSVILRDRAEELRFAALALGNYYSNRDGQLQTRIVAEPSGWHIMQWPAGTPFPQNASDLEVDEWLNYSNNLALFVEGGLQLWGSNVQGRATVGSEGDMRLMDDIRYPEYDPSVLTPRNQENSFFLQDMQSNNILGLISESRIRVANTDANGRGNGRNQGAWTNHDNKHIIITAAVITLGGSFDFENQNNRPDDPFGWDGYWWCDPEGTHPNQQDERGAIYLRGSVIQRNRGYVHRSNCGGTGYDKEYAYDIRMWKTPPPYFPKETDAEDRYNFQIVSSWDKDPTMRVYYE